MKKLVLMAAIILAATSCKKSYTCECNTVSKGAYPGTPAIRDYTLKEKNAGDAKGKCIASGVESTDYITACDLK